MNIDVFISHSSKDANIAKAICNTLESNGIRVWIAPRDIMPGSDWAESINNAIESSKAMVLVFSEYSNDSVQVAKELNLAVNNKLVILPFKIDKTDPTGSMKYYLSDTHWLDAINGDMKDEIEKLKDILISVLPQSLDVTTIANSDNTAETATLEETPSDSKKTNSTSLEKINKASILKKWIIPSIVIALALMITFVLVFFKNANTKDTLIKKLWEADISIKDEQYNVIILDEHIKEISAEKIGGSEYDIKFQLNDQGTNILASYTANNIGEPLYVYLNEHQIYSPQITEEISNGLISVYIDDEVLTLLEKKYEHDDSIYHTEWTGEQVELGNWTVPYKVLNKPIIDCIELEVELSISNVVSGNPYGTWEVYVRTLEEDWVLWDTIYFEEDSILCSTFGYFNPAVSFDAIAVSRQSSESSNHGYDFNIISYKSESSNNNDILNDYDTLKIGYTECAPSSYYNVMGELVGFDVELAQYVCNQLGITPEFIEISWEMKEQLINNGKIDCVWNAMVETPERKEQMSCTQPYLSVQNDDGSVENWVVGFGNDNLELSSLINEQLQLAKEEGVIQSLSEKYPIWVAN